MRSHERAAAAELVLTALSERVQELSCDRLAAAGQLPKARHIADVGLLVRSNGAVDLDEMLADALE